ncbi:reverse transcriptase domain-containing protein [Tanacetum coccineum]
MLRMHKLVYNTLYLDDYEYYSLALRDEGFDHLCDGALLHRYQELFIMSSSTDFFLHMVITYFVSLLKTTDVFKLLESLSPMIQSRSQWTRIALFIFLSHDDVDLSADVWSLRNIGCQAAENFIWFAQIADVIIADKFAPDANSQIVPATAIPDGWMGLDIGPDSVKTFNDALETTKTFIWNGPMGVFEFDKFEVGTESAFDRLSDTYSPSTTKSGPDRANLEDRSHSRSRPHRRDSSNRDRPRSRDHSRGVKESYYNTRSSYGTWTKHGYRSCDRDCSRYEKKGRESESPSSRISESNTSDGGHWKLMSKRHKSTDEDDLVVPWICEEVDPFTPRIRNFKSSRKIRMPNNVKTYDGTGDPEDHEPQEYGSMSSLRRAWMDTRISKQPS